MPAFLPSPLFGVGGRRGAAPSAMPSLAGAGADDACVSGVAAVRRSFLCFFFLPEAGLSCSLGLCAPGFAAAAAGALVELFSDDLRFLAIGS